MVKNKKKLKTEKKLKKILKINKINDLLSYFWTISPNKFWFFIVFHWRLLSLHLDQFFFVCLSSSWLIRNIDFICWTQISWFIIVFTIVEFIQYVSFMVPIILYVVFSLYCLHFIRNLLLILDLVIILAVLRLRFIIFDCIAPIIIVHERFFLMTLLGIAILIVIEMGESTPTGVHTLLKLRLIILV